MQIFSRRATSSSSMAPRSPAAVGAAPLFLFIYGAAVAACLLTSAFMLSDDVALSDEEIEQFNSTPASFVDGAEQGKRYPKFTSTVAIPSDSRERLLRQLQEELELTAKDGGQKPPSMLQHTNVGSKLSQREEALLKAATPGYSEMAGDASDDEDEEFDDLYYDADDADHRMAFADLEEPESELDEEEDGDEDHEGHAFLEDFERDDEPAEGQAVRSEKTTRSQEEEREFTVPENTDDPAFFEDEMHASSSDNEDDTSGDPEAFLEEDEQEDDDAFEEEEEMDSPADTYTALFDDPYANSAVATPSALEKFYSREEKEGAQHGDGGHKRERAEKGGDEITNPDADQEVITSFIEMAPVQQSIRAHFRTNFPRAVEARTAAPAAAAADQYTKNRSMYLYHGRTETHRPPSFSEEGNLEVSDQGPAEEELLREAEGNQAAAVCAEEVSDTDFPRGEEEADEVGAEPSQPAGDSVDLASADYGGDQEPPVESSKGVKEEDVLGGGGLAAPPEEEAASLGAGPPPASTLGPKAGPLAEQMEKPEKPAEQYSMRTTTVAGPAAGLTGTLETERLEMQSSEPRVTPSAPEEDVVLGPVGVGGEEAVETAGAGEYFPGGSLSLQGRRLREPAEDILHRHGWEDMKLTQGLLMDKIKARGSAQSLSSGWSYGAAALTAVAAAIL